MNKKDYELKKCIICGKGYYWKYPSSQKRTIFKEYPKRRKSAKTCSKKCSEMLTYTYRYFYKHDK
jgi:hypothetical protein